jgi:hypothetical protein
VNYSGTHLLADLFGCTGLDDIGTVEAALRNAVAAGGATLLELRLHGFGAGQGVTGVALLAESHISIPPGPSATMPRPTSSCAATGTISMRRWLRSPPASAPNAIRNNASRAASVSATWRPDRLYPTVTRCVPPASCWNAVLRSRNKAMMSAAVVACWLGFTVVNTPPPAMAKGSSNWSAR